MCPMVLNVWRVPRIWQEHSTASAFSAEGFSKHTPFCSALAAAEREKNSPHLLLTLVLDLSLAATASIPACIVLPRSRLTLFGFFIIIFYFFSFSVFFPDQKSKWFSAARVDAAAAERSCDKLQRRRLSNCQHTSLPSATSQKPSGNGQDWPNLDVFAEKQSVPISAFEWKCKDIH